MGARLVREPARRPPIICTTKNAYGTRTALTAFVVDSAVFLSTVASSMLGFLKGRPAPAAASGTTVSVSDDVNTQSQWLRDARASGLLLQSVQMHAVKPASPARSGIKLSYLKRLTHSAMAVLSDDADMHAFARLLVRPTTKAHDNCRWGRYLLSLSGMAARAWCLLHGLRPTASTWACLANAGWWRVAGWVD